MKNPKIGLWDTKDNCWMGNVDGPLLYDDRDVAQIACQVVCAHLIWPATRIRPLPFTGAIQKLDDLKPLRSSDEAWKHVMGGGL